MDTGHSFPGSRHPWVPPTVVSTAPLRAELPRWSLPLDSVFGRGGTSPSDGRTHPGGGPQTSKYVGPVVWTGRGV